MGKMEYVLEFTDFRPINVENVAATEGTTIKNLHNIGPSFQYKLRNSQGTAKEFNNYMLPIDFDGAWYLLSGVRDSGNDPFRYLRLPLDQEQKLDGYIALQKTLLDKNFHPEIIERFMRNSANSHSLDQAMRQKLQQSATYLLTLFAQRGYDGLAEYLKNSVAEQEQEKAAAVYLKLLEVITFEAYQTARLRAHLSPARNDESTARFIRDSLNSISDGFLYGSPFYLQLTGFDEIKASGLQLTRSPGKNLVYLGSILLVLGVFAMFYIHERRLWLLIKPQERKLLLPMSSNRKTLDFEKDFTHQQAAVLKLLKDEDGTHTKL
jgi:cytochrome c biogenesis protein